MSSSDIETHATARTQRRRAVRRVRLATLVLVPPLLTVALIRSGALVSHATGAPAVEAEPRTPQRADSMRAVPTPVAPPLRAPQPRNEQRPGETLTANAPAGPVSAAPVPPVTQETSTRAAIDRLGRLAMSEGPTDAQVRQAVADGLALLPTLTTRADSVETHWHLIALYWVHLQDDVAACRLIRVAAPLAAGTPYAAGIASYLGTSSPLRCQ